MSCVEKYDSGKKRDTNLAPNVGLKKMKNPNSQ